LGFRPELRVDGPVDTMVPDEVRPALLAVLREALSNVARHAEAGEVSIVVTAGRGELTLTVRDDGRGYTKGEQSATRGNGDGVRNMRARANELGGVCMLARAEPGGTLLTWRVPI
jgi:signal transduction histidine kinase